MNAIMIVLVAATFTALSSLSFRRYLDSSQTASNPTGYLVVFYLLSFILSFFIFPDIWWSEVSYTMIGIGMVTGILNSSLMFYTSKALKHGPAGMTYAFQNASAIFPGIILFMILGSDFGFSCSLLQLAGMALVLVGLFIGAKGQAEGGEASNISGRWLKYAVICFLIQILALTCIQARAVLFNLQGDNFFSHLNITEAHDIWFMPAFFAMSSITQLTLYFRENKKLQKPEFMYGSLGGIANFSSTCLLLIATKWASPFEKGILFPCFAVAAMILCNLWATKLYQEKFNFKTNLLCSFGIFLAVAS
jgi:hypothetical protein